MARPSPRKPAKPLAPSKPEVASTRALTVSKGAPAPVRPTHLTRLTRLTRAQHAVLAEALRRGESTRDEVESALLDFGRWLLEAVFGDDVAAALGRRAENAVWRELVARAGGPTLRLGERFLIVSVTIAANDRRIQDDSWRLLEAGRKEILLPLREPAALREAAQHVVAMKLSQRKTRAYVRSLLAAQGKAQQRRVSVPRLETQVRKFRERVGDAAFRRGLERSVRVVPVSARGGVRKELEALRAAIDGMLAIVRA